MQVVACNMATYMVSVFRYCQAFLIKKKKHKIATQQQQKKLKQGK